MTYPLPAVIITSGDFVVRFLVANAVNIAPADLDRVTTSQQRSYSSSGGLTNNTITRSWAIG
jgi:hypothetical protein